MSAEHPSLALIRKLEARHKWEQDTLRAEIERLTADNKGLRAALIDMLAWADTPTQEASPSWIIGACERAKAAVKETGT